MAKERLGYIDISKGIMILLVLLAHIPLVYASVDHVVLDYLRKFTISYIPLLMPAFFVLTGYCSSFNKSFKEIFISSFRTIALPGITFTIFFFLLKMRFNAESLSTLMNAVFIKGGNFWFLPALFVGRLLFWFVHHYTKGIPYYLCLCLSFFIGLILYNLSPGIEFWRMYHGMMLMPFIGLGSHLKKIGYQFDHFWTIFILYALTFGLVIFLSSKNNIDADSNYAIPFIAGKITNMNPITLIPFLVISVSGSLMIVTLCKYISSCPLLEYFGRNSLTIYCLQGYALHVVFLCSARFLSHDTPIIIAFLIILFGFLLSIVACGAVAYVVNTKYLRFMIGKF